MNKNGVHRYAAPLEIPTSAPAAKPMGRPKGAMRPEKKTFLEKCRLEGPASLKRMVYLRDHGETHAVQLAAAIAIADRGFGKPPQAVAVGMDGGGGQTLIMVRTGVPRSDYEGDTRWSADDPQLPQPRPLTIEGKP